jgi:hypothetical protein
LALKLEDEIYSIDVNDSLFQIASSQTSSSSASGSSANRNNRRVLSFEDSFVTAPTGISTYIESPGDYSMVYQGVFDVVDDSYGSILNGIKLAFLIIFVSVSL